MTEFNITSISEFNEKFDDAKLTKEGTKKDGFTITVETPNETEVVRFFPNRRYTINATKYDDGGGKLKIYIENNNKIILKEKSYEW